jgi:hypothetical protein
MLREDIKMLSVTNGWESGVISINAGTDIIEPGRYLDGIKRPDKFHCGIYRPKESWRRLGKDELSKVIGITSASNFANTLCVIDVPDRFRSTFYHRKLNEMSISPKHWDEKMQSEFPAFAFEVSEWLRQEVFEEFEMCSAFVNFTRPRINTTTFDLSQNRYRGLHIDNWGNPLRNAKERDTSGIRVCINLGFAPRDVVFINLRLKSMLDLLALKRGAGEVQDLYEETYGQPLAEDFLNEYSDYPVLKLNLKQSQAYIGPVQNMIHDGYPLFQKSVDVNLQLSANFFRYRSTFIAHALSKATHFCCA